MPEAGSRWASQRTERECWSRAAPALFPFWTPPRGGVLKKITAVPGGDLDPGEPIEDGGRIYFGTQNGRVYEIDAAGVLRPILDLGPGAVHTLLALGGGRLIAANVDGLVIAFERLQ